MKIRKAPLGNKNMVGATVESIRKSRGIKQKDFVARLQTSGVDINPTSYSKLEGQVRVCTDIEVYTISKILGVSIDELFKKR